MYKNLTKIVILVFLCVSLMAAGGNRRNQSRPVVLGESDLIQINEVLCGFVKDEFVPGDLLRNGKFFPYQYKIKRFRKRLRRAQRGTRRAKRLRKRVKRFRVKLRAGNETCQQGQVNAEPPTPSPAPTLSPTPTPTATLTPSYTPTATASPTSTPTATATSTAALPTATYTPTPSYTPTPTPTVTCQEAPSDAATTSLTIPLDNTTSVLDFVSFPGGDTTDSVQYSVSGMNPIPSFSGGRANLTISASCFGENVDQVEFFTGGQTFSCGQTLVAREITSDSDTGSIIITAIGGECTYVQWVLTATAVRIN